MNIEGVTGHNVSLDAPGDLEKALISLLTDREGAAAMGQRGLERWRENFSYSKFRERFTPLFEEFAKAKPRRFFFW